MAVSTNYGFNLPGYNDFADIKDLTDNWELVDQILKDGGGTMFGKTQTEETAQKKVIAFTDQEFIDNVGAILVVNMETANTREDLITFQIDEGSERQIYVNGVVTSATNPLTWNEGETLTFVYDGTRFWFISRDMAYVNRLQFEALYELCTRTTTIGRDLQGHRQITEVDADNGMTAVTTIVNTSDTVKTITTVIQPTSPSAGDSVYTKTTTVTKTSGGKTVAESYAVSTYSE